MSNSILPRGIEPAVTSLSTFVNDRLETRRVMAKYIRSVKVPDYSSSVPAHEFNSTKGVVDRVAQRELETVESNFALTEPEIREADLASALLKTEHAVRKFIEDEDTLLFGKFMKKASSAATSHKPLPHDHLAKILDAGSELMRDVQPKAVVLLIESSMFDELNKLMPPQYSESPLNHVERAERLRIQVIVSADRLPKRKGLMFGFDPAQTAAVRSAPSVSGDQFTLIDRPVGIAPELTWTGWDGGNLQFRILSTFTVRIKDPQAFKVIDF